MWIPSEFGSTSRTIKLEGEAFFNVVHDEKHPFVVQSPNAVIKDLGTAFNVKASPGEQNVQVAVTEGKVTLRAVTQDEAAARELAEGQYAYLDLQNNPLAVDEFGISNYLSWMNGRFTFDSVPLENVCRQINRIYGVSFRFTDTALKTLRLTTNTEWEYGNRCECGWQYQRSHIHQRTVPGLQVRMVRLPTGKYPPHLFGF